MNGPDRESELVLAEIEQVADRHQAALASWEELLAEAHAVSEEIQQRVQQVTAVKVSTTSAN
jgi:uncharacterized protein YmfQ (DUF2313 family)